MNSSIYRPIILVCVVAASVGGAPAQSVYELCPTDPTVISGEKECIDAIAAAERDGDLRSLRILVEAIAIRYEKGARYNDAIAALRKGLALDAVGQSYDLRVRLARLLEKNGSLDDSRIVLLDLLSAARQSVPASTLKVAHLELSLAETEAKRMQPEAAEIHFLRSIDAFSAGLGRDASNPAVPRLIQFYLNANRRNDAVGVCDQYRESMEIQPGAQNCSCDDIIPSVDERAVGS